MISINFIYATCAWNAASVENKREASSSVVAFRMELRKKWGE